MNANTTKEQLVYIPINELYPHPDNPRKDLGDLTELSESIKSKGIMQNLTVVKGHVQTDAEFLSLCEQYKENPSEELRAKLNERTLEDGYTVIIGHRRCAAAKIAGVKELPCVIVEMSMQDQVATMLLENMQRSDLTVYEQAQGFQMMLNLGDTVEGIAEKSGFSESTVRRRIKLNELDQEQLKEASANRQISMGDLDKLDKIKDIDERNLLLKSIGTNNFNYAYNNAIERQKDKEKRNEIIELINRHGNISFVDCKDKKFWDKYKRIHYIWNYEDILKTIEKLDSETKYYYSISSFSITVEIYVERQAEAEENPEVAAKKAETKKQRNEIEQKLEEIKENSRNLRREFISNCSKSVIRKNLISIINIFNKQVINDEYVSCDFDDLIELYKDIPYDDSNEENIEYMQFIEENPEKIFLCLVYISLDDSKWKRYYNDMELSYSGSEELDAIYELLLLLGYQMSDDEKKMKDGTHQLFIEAERLWREERILSEVTEQ